MRKVSTDFKVLAVAFGGGPRLGGEGTATMGGARAAGGVGGPQGQPWEGALFWAGSGAVIQEEGWKCASFQLPLLL